jgi:DUF1680 family protein
MNRREFVGACGSAGIAWSAPTAGAANAQTPPAFGEVRLTGGLLHDRFLLNARRTFEISPVDLLMPYFRAKGLSNGGRELNHGFTDRTQTGVWPGLYSGFWMSGAAHIARWSNEPAHRKVLAEMVHELAKTREPDGFLLAMGRDPAQRWAHNDLYALVRVTVRALLDVYEVTGEKAALEMARGQMDCMIRDIVGRPGRGEGIRLRGTDPVKVAPSYYKLLPALSQLAVHTHDPKYLEVADMCLDLKLMETMLEGKRDGLPGRHASTWVDHLMGVYQIGRLTGNSRYVDFVLKSAARIRNHHLFITGSMSSNEEWRTGEHGWQLQESNRAQETCCAAIWISLLQNLLHGTGDPVHAEAVESAAYNAVFASQSPETGDFCYFVNLSGRGKPYDPPPEWGRHCCEGTGLMAIGRLPGLIYGKTAEGLAINLYAASELTTEIGGVRVRVVQETTWPLSGKVRIRVEPKRPVRFALACRVPSWAGSQQAQRFDREWKSGDFVDLDFSIEPRVVIDNFNGVPRAGLQYGPLVMAAAWDDSVPVRKVNLNKVIHGAHSFFEEWPFPPSLLVRGGSAPVFTRLPGPDLAFQAEAVPPGVSESTAPFQLRFVPFCSDIRSKYSVWLPLQRKA